MPEYSIVIPFQATSAYLMETLEHIGRLRGVEFEVILLPDGPLDHVVAENRTYPVKIIPTGPVSPAIKRDIGSTQASGRFLAFIDDDAYPDPDWLSKVAVHFTNASVAAVGGPQITPPGDGFWQQVSGAMFLSPLNGQAVGRYWPCPGDFEVDDWPSVNLVVRKEEFLAVGGFDSAYWPGEDTKLCLDLTKKLGRMISYAPDAMVFHHRRSGFVRHMRQVGNYGLHRGYFAKHFPETSLKIVYFIPSVFFLFVTLGWAVIFLGEMPTALYFGLWCLYLAGLIISTASIHAKINNLLVAAATVPYLVGTHFWYGWRFIHGLVLSRKLQSQLGR